MNKNIFSRSIVIAAFFLTGLSPFTLRAQTQDTNPQAQTDKAAVKESQPLLPPPSMVLRTVIIGGGPSKAMNQCAIESNVRYLNQLLPAGTPRTVLFADGKLDTPSVRCQTLDEATKKLTNNYRIPQLPRLDGPSLLPDVRSGLSTLVGDPSQVNTPTLLYFTGHGSADKANNYENNWFNLWNGTKLTVKELASQIAQFPKQTPVTIVMVQCYAGAFGNLLFRDGDPKGPLVDQHIAGYFASIPQRVAAGCTTEINEANYRDFSSYFFAALTGIDRLGKPVTGADYNHDGKVGMDEAFAYTLANDDSIDTPVSTSDVFVRRFVEMKEEKRFKVKYSKFYKWATPAQRAALDGLSEKLNLTDEKRSHKAWEEFKAIDPKVRVTDQAKKLREARLIRFVRLTETVVLAHNMEKVKDKELKVRFAELLKQESTNPLKPETDKK